MRPRERRFGLSFVASVSFAFAVVALGSEREADAKECTNPLVSSCINSDTYWPNAGPMRFLNVANTETLAQGQIGFGLVTTYLSRPVLLRIASPGPGGSDQYVVDDQVNGNFLFAYGVTDRLQLDLGVPITFVQSGAGTSPLTGGPGLRDTALRDLRFGLAYALVPRARIDTRAAAEQGGPGKAWALTARVGVSVPVGDSDNFAGERTAVFMPDIAFDYRLGPAFFGADVGARLRPVTEFAGARVGTQITTAAGAGIDVLEHDRLSLMIDGRAYWNLVEQHDTQQSAFGIASTPNGKMITPAEWMVSVRSAPLLAGDLAFTLGGGGPIPLGDPAITAPRYRFTLGVVYAPLQHDTDGDGVPDRVDACPTRAGERVGTRPGCPAEETPTP